MQVICIYYHNFLQNVKNVKKQINFNKLETMAKVIYNKPKIRKITIFVLGNLLYCKTALAKEVVSTIKINEAGNALLSVCRTIGYWTCIIMCITSIIKELLQGDTKSIAKIIMKYSLAFSSFYLLPFILDLIRKTFS